MERCSCPCFHIFTSSHLHIMLVLLSPAKDLDLSPDTKVKAPTQPEFLSDSEELIGALRKLDTKRIAKLMDLSPKLAALNHERYQAWAVPFTRKNAKPAIFSFNGDVYKGLDAKSLTDEDLRFAQRHVRMLSGLHGLLRPFDLMQPYRLEMGCGFGVDRKRKDLYAFWGERITDALNKELALSKGDVVVNLASSEYFKAVQPAGLKARTITPMFKDKTPGGYRMLMLFAKQQRGRMCRWIVQHRMLDAERLKTYDGDGYRFAPDMSEGDQWTFVRDKRP